jgi:hypothetical protein
MRSFKTISLRPSARRLLNFLGVGYSGAQGVSLNSPLGRGPITNVGNDLLPGGLS